MGMTPVIGATVGTVGGFAAGAIVGDGIGVVSGADSAEVWRPLVEGPLGGEAVLAAGKRAGRLTGALIGGTGGATTGAAVGVIIDNRKSQS